MKTRNKRLTFRDEGFVTTKNKIAVSRIQLVAVGLLALSLPTFAQGPGWTVNSTIVKLVDTSAGGINIRLSPELTGCTSISGYGPAYASVYPDHAAINRIKASLLTAYATGAPIALYLSDSTCRVTEIALGGF